MVEDTNKILYNGYMKDYKLLLTKNKNKALMVKLPFCF